MSAVLGASPRPRRAEAPDDRALDRALDDAVAVAGRLVADGCRGLVGLIDGGAPSGLRRIGRLDPRLERQLCAAIPLPADGAAWAGPTGSGWWGVAVDCGDGRRAVAVIESGRPRSTQAAALERALLRLVRAALVAAGRRRAEQLTQLLATARRVAESLDLETVLAAIVEDAARLLGADSGDMLLWDRERDRLRVVAVWNFQPEMLGFELAFGEGLSSQAILAQRTLAVDDYRTYEHRAPGLDAYDFGPVVCAPLLFRGEAIGALNVHSAKRGHRFVPDDLELLAAFAGHAAIAIDHARRYENEVRLGADLAETNRELTRSLTVQQRLAEQVLLDGGPAGIARVLAEHLGRRVVIQDHLRRVIAGASPTGGDEWRSLSEAPAAHRGDGSPRSPEPFSLAVRVGRDVVGHVLLSADDELAPIDRALVEVATTGVALEFAKLRAALDVEERLRGETLSDLLAGAYPTPDAIAARAARLGYDLSEPRDLLLVDVGDTDEPGRAAETAPSSRHDRTRRVLDLVREYLAARSPRTLVGVHAGSIVVLASPHRPERDVRQLAGEIRAYVEATAAPGTITVAIGDRCDGPDDYAASFGVARSSLEVMLKLGRAGAIVGARELGTYGLLLRASSRLDLEVFARRLLQPLVEHDERHGGELLATLRAYLEEDRIQRRVAARCFIHVNTVVYRVRRIEELLGLDLADPRVVFDLTLALRVLDLLDPPTSVESAGSGRPVRPRRPGAAPPAPRPRG